MQISDSCRQDMFIARSSREKEVTGLHVKDLFSNAFICFFFFNIVLVTATKTLYHSGIVTGFRYVISLQ